MGLEIFGNGWRSLEVFFFICQGFVVSRIKSHEGTKSLQRRTAGRSASTCVCPARRASLLASASLRRSRSTVERGNGVQFSTIHVAHAGRRRSPTWFKQRTRVWKLTPQHGHTASPTRAVQGARAPCLTRLCIWSALSDANRAWHIRRPLVERILRTC